MNLSLNLVVLLVLFNGLKYSLCEESLESYVDCDPPKNAADVIQEGMYCSKIGYNMLSGDKEELCCLSVDQACSVNNALRTQCKPKSDFDSKARSGVSGLRKLICTDQGVSPTKSLCKSKMSTTDPKCANYEPNICDAVLPLSVDGLILWLSFFIPLINILF